MTFYPEYTAAFFIGFLGSLHCLGMCGPIALVLPSLGHGTIGRLLGGLVYNAGRILTYSVLGFLMGMAGKGFALFQWQQGLSISVGILIVLYNVLPGLFSRLKAKAPLRFNTWVKASLAEYLKRKSAGGLLFIGLLNGLLPCGLVYLGLAGSLDMTEPSKGAFFMGFFGLGTLPMMSGIHLFGYNLKSSLKSRISKLIPFLAVLIGLLFILRGLGLGIPYLSPSMDPHTGDIHCTSPAHRH